MSRTLLSPKLLDHRTKELRKMWDAQLDKALDEARWAWSGLWEKNTGPEERVTHKRVHRPTESIALNGKRRLYGEGIRKVESVLSDLVVATACFKRAAGDVPAKEGTNEPTLEEDERDSIDFPAKYLPGCGPRYTKKQQALQSVRKARGGGFGAD